MPTLIKSISGIRGIVGDGLDPVNLVNFAAAFAKYCNFGKIIVGRDSRISGEYFEKIISGTLLACGCEVINIGICPTPTVQIYIEDFKADGGIAITASHNPNEWNALKLMNREGTFLTPTEALAYFNIEKLSNFRFNYWDKIGKYIEIKDSYNYHIDKVFNLKNIDFDKIKNRKFKVLLDCVNGAGVKVVPSLLDKLNCEYDKINCDDTGIFPRLPEPLPENLKETMAYMKKDKYDLGIVVDPDVDRLVLLTGDGEAFGEEYTVTLAVKSVLSLETGPVCVNLSTTRAVEDIANFYNVPFYRTPTGEINVVEKMKEVKSIIGGEGSGGVIYPKLHFGRDALIGIVLILNYLATNEISLKKEKSLLPQYFIRKEKFNINNLDKNKIFDELKSRFNRGKLDERDGIRIDYDDFWILCRESNTEPIIRFTVEAESEKEAEKIMNEIKLLLI